MNLTHLLAHHARHRPHSPALTDHHARRDRTLTYAQLDHAVNLAAARLRHARLPPDSPVLCLAPLSLPLYIALLALLRSRHPVLLPDLSAGPARCATGCQRLPPALLLGTHRARLLALLSPEIRRIPRFLHVSHIGAPLPSPSDPRPDPDPTPTAPHHPALVTFTSGTTGPPKILVRTHAFLLAQHSVLADSLHLQPGQTDLATLPVFVLAHLASGLHVILPQADLARPASIAPAPLLRQISRLRPDRCAASPALLQRLLDHPAPPSPHPLHTFRHLHTGGAPVPPRLLRQLASAAPSARVTAIYGSSEAEPIAHLDLPDISPADLLAMRSGHGLLAGHPVPQIRLLILPDRWGQPLPPIPPDQLRSLALPPGQPGEIIVTGPHVLPGYLNAIGDTDTKLHSPPHTWHRTGDTGLLDPRGRLWLLGRCAHTIRDPLGTLHPLAVETAALEHFPHIARCACLLHRHQRTLVLQPRLRQTPPDLREINLALPWANLQNLRTLPQIPTDPRHNAKTDLPRLLRLLG